MSNPTDIVLVLDRSGSMAGSPLANLKSGAKKFIQIIDESTDGLDPEERIRFRGIISNLSRRKTVLLSTHIVSDLKAVANEMILLKKVRVLAVQTPHDLLRELAGMVWTVTAPAENEKDFAGKFPCSNIMHGREISVLRILSNEKPHDEAVAEQPNMEDMYLYYFGK